MGEGSRVIRDTSIADSPISRNGISRGMERIDDCSCGGKMRVHTTRNLRDGSRRQYRKCNTCGSRLTTDIFPVSGEMPPIQRAA